MTMTGIRQASLGVVFSICFFTLSAQTDSLRRARPELHFAAFVDVFYAYDFNRPETDYRQLFLFNHNRHNEFNLNLGLLRVDVSHAWYRAGLALHTGTYAIDNYAAEPGLLQNIFEAYAGISLSRRHDLWLDAGIFTSHIGFESAVSADNWTLSRSLMAENSPYFLTGARLSYAPDDAWQLVAVICNGWQRIRRLPGNSLPSFGTQVLYQPHERLTLNWSTFIGTETPDSTRQMRYFNNLYGQFQLAPRVGIIGAFDFGIQQQSRGSADYDFWFSPNLIAQFTLSERWKTAVRLEYYHDANNVKIVPLNGYGFRTTGFSWNIDYLPLPEVACRLEGRWLGSEDDIFETESGYTRTNFTVLASIAVKLGK